VTKPRENNVKFYKRLKIAVHLFDLQFTFRLLAIGHRKSETIALFFTEPFLFFVQRNFQGEMPRYAPTTCICGLWQTCAE